MRLIDESFAFFHPNPIVPNLTMLYQPEWDTFVEAGGWRGWWIQNSYGIAVTASFCGRVCLAASPVTPRRSPSVSATGGSSKVYAEKGDARQKGVAGLFAEARKASASQP